MLENMGLLDAYDVTELVLQGTQSSTQEPIASDWTIVAYCSAGLKDADPDIFKIGMVSTVRATQEIASSAKRGEYNKLINDESDLPENYIQSCALEN